MPRKNAEPTNNASESIIQILEQPKKGKNMQPEQMFKHAFEALLSKKDGTARLTFAGYKHSVTKNGERPYLDLIWSCLDITRENPANISVLSNYRYSKTNVLGKLLKAVNYIASNQTETVLDPDDEFGYKIQHDLSDIYDFLDSKRGLVFKGVLTKNERNLYRIEVDTLQPLLGKDGKQQRDYAAEEGLSEKEIAVDIEADGGDK